MKNSQLSWGLAALAAGSLFACGGSQKQATTPDNERVDVRPIDSQADEPDDGLEVEGLLGSLDPEEATPVVQKAFPEIERCYSDNVGANRFVAGRVQLKFRVARDGSVKRVQAELGDLGAWPIEKCVLEVARGLTFPRPRGGEAELRIPIDFPGRGSVVTLGEDQATAELSSVIGDLGSCAEAPSGQVRVTLYVGPGGEVKSAGFTSEEEEPFAAPWADCAHEKAIAWKLTDPRGRVWKLQGTFAP